MDISQARKALQPLLDRYNQNKDNFTFTGNEKQVCQSLIIPFFHHVLGWDVEDPSEFKTEESRGGKRIDFVVYNKGISQFIIETKALDRDIFGDRAAYKQALDYGYSKDKDFSILTNFRQVVILGSKSSYRVPEEAEVARIDLLKASDKDIELLLSFEKGYWTSQGKENRLYARLTHHKPQIPVDERLLEDMKHWREQLLGNLKKNHPSWKFEDEQEFMHIEEEVQKFIDRLIFVCFCEDKELHEPHLKALMAEKIERHHGNLGWLLGKINEVFDEFDKRYDSDLFDESLVDKFKIDDDKLIDVLRDLREPPQRPAYDFKSIEADILGKVYENFIGHIQAGKKRFKEHEDKGKRKKTGIYYTPKFIVDYIVNNTVREYIKEKSFDEILKVRILDPACGSGSFLIRAFDVLCEVGAKKLGKEELTYAQRKDLMLNCVFGVDLDERAVAIAKLNLSLRMAERGNLLPMLNGNIRHGDSLIDDSNIVGYHAFVWNEEFKEIINEGGFDIIIGNPPYVRQEQFSQHKPFFQSSYEVYNGVADLFVYFFEREIKLLKEHGLFGMIVSNKWLKAGYALELRKFLQRYKGEICIDFGDLQIFPGATTYPCIVIIDKTLKPNPTFRICQVKNLDFTSLEAYVKQNQFAIPQETLNEKGWNFQDNKGQHLLQKLRLNGIPLGQYVENKVKRGVLTGYNPAFIIDKETKEKLIKESATSKEIIKPFLNGSDVRRYAIKSSDHFLIFTRRGIDIKKYPAILRYLEQFKSQLTPKRDSSQEVGRKPGNYKWYEIQDTVAFHQELEKTKIIFGEIQVSPRFTLDNEGYYVNNKVYFFPRKDLHLLAVLNSKMCWYLIQNTCTKVQGGFQVSWSFLRTIPLPKNRNQDLENLSEKMLHLNFSLNALNEPRTLEEEKLQREIERTDHEIDELVYKLYDITDEEKKIIEESLQ